MLSGIAVFGGTFDPVHFGHLRSAIEVAEFLSLKSVRLIPASHPAHRGSPLSTSEQRLQMLKLAVAEESALEVDDRECRRTGPSFMVDTLASLRAEFGSDQPLILVLGIDSFLTLAEWYKWQRIIQLAHILVLNRPGWDHRNYDPDPELNKLLKDREVFTRESLLVEPSGKILRINLSQLEISATGIRQAVANQQSIRYLVPDAVLEYISNNGIYAVDQNEG
jgi:nicotinate-nucleotide adenylyltransferase